MEEEREAVVYKITCKENGKFYIGVTVNFNNRMSYHKNNPPIKMREDVKKYGWDTFEKIITYNGTENQCYIEEIKIVDEKDINSYNTVPGGMSGSGVKGIANGNAKISDEDVRKVRYLWNIKAYSLKELGDMYNMDKSGISLLVLGKNRKEAGGIISEIQDKNGENYHSTKLTNNDIVKIRELGKLGKTQQTIAEYFNMIVGRRHIGKIITGDLRIEVGGPIKGIDYE